MQTKSTTSLKAVILVRLSKMVLVVEVHRRLVKEPPAPPPRVLLHRPKQACPKPNGSPLGGPFSFSG